MPKYLYKTSKVKGSKDWKCNVYDEQLKQWGELGWELINVQLLPARGSYGGYTFLIFWRKEK